jgi:formate--tetrahydrofolate ligase
VATIRALKFHGGVKKEDLNRENLDALDKGIVNIERHLKNITLHYGLPCVVSVNHFTFDTDAEIALLKERIEALGGHFVVARHWAEGGKGAEDVARAVVELAEGGHGHHKFVYEDTDTLQAKIIAIATKIYGAGQVTFSDAVRKQLDEWNKEHGHFPVCMAKTQMSFSADPSVRGAPSGHTLNVREVRLANGAGFIVAICGDMMTMPGLPKVPSAERIDIDDDGKVSGLF